MDEERENKRKKRDEVKESEEQQEHEEREKTYHLTSMLNVEEGRKKEEKGE